MLHSIRSIASIPSAPSAPSVRRPARLWPVLLALLLACAPLLAPRPVQALTAAEIEAGNQAARRIQQEQEERRLQQLREDERRRGQAPTLEAPEARAPRAARGGVCRDIEQITLAGVTLLPEELRARLTTSYQGRCLQAEDIERLMGDVLKAYMDRGYVAVRPYVQAQDLAQGRLTILVVEGKLSSIRFKDGDGGRINRSTAFPFTQGKPLNLRDIEQGLDQINRLASNQATMEIEPGDEEGASVVVVDNTPRLPYSASATVDNLGGLSTGRHQAGYTLGVDSPLLLNDYLTYTHKNTVLESSRLRESRSDSLFYSLPLGYWTLQASYSSSDYHSPVSTATNTLISRGTSESLRLELGRVLYRDQDQKLSGLVAMNAKTSRNYLADSFLEVSSRTLSILDVDLSWNGRTPLGSLNAMLGLSQGVRQFNAKVDAAGTGVTSPHAQGGKLRYGAGIALPFQVAGQELNFSSQLTGQFALEPLYGSEQISIGSHYSVRGFNRHSASGDRGWYVRNELSTALPAFSPLAVVARPFVAFDGGRIEGFKTTRDANLTGVAAGVRVSGSHVAGELSAAKALSIPVNQPHEPVQFATTLTVSF